MMKIYQILICILILIQTSSCASLRKDALEKTQIRLTKENSTLLNGTYARASMNNPEDFEGDLFWNFFTRGYNVGADSLCSVNIRVVNEKSLNVTLVKDDSIIKSKILKGKIKNGYFEMNRRTFIVPAVYLNVFRTTKFRIGILEDKNLTTDFKEISWGTGFVIIPFYNKDVELDYVYRRKDHF